MESSDRGTQMKMWHQYVEQYTRRTLSVESDVFPVLQGIARALLSQRSCGYYAGLWENTLLEDLLWYCTSSNKRPGDWESLNVVIDMIASDQLHLACSILVLGLRCRPGSLAEFRPSQ